MLLPDGTICALSAERVGDRLKHSFDSQAAYDYLRAHHGAAEAHYRAEDDGFSQPMTADLQGARHHFNHAASAFFGSGFPSSAVLIVDGQGPESGALATTTIWRGLGHSLELVENLDPEEGQFASRSLGHFYTAIGALAGIGSLQEEGKTMGLAAYGRRSRFLEYFEQFVTATNDGRVLIDGRLTLAILGNTLGATIFKWPPQPASIQSIWDELLALRRHPLETRPNQDDADIAFAGQQILERALLGLADRARSLTGERNLCLAGGVALNCVANERLRQAAGPGSVFVFPAAGDDGQAIGKLFAQIHARGIVLTTAIDDMYFGPSYGSTDVRDAIAGKPQLHLVSDNALDTCRAAALRLAEGKIIGCCRGRSELGPRALGHRSLFADPRRPDIRDRINFFVKGREWYRPVAPMVLEESASRYFEVAEPSPYMTFAVGVRESAKSRIPAVVHADGTARVQTISRRQEPFLCDLLVEFERITALPILVNTSFNHAGQPLVETYAEAVQAMEDMCLDGVILENCLVECQGPP